MWLLLSMGRPDRIRGMCDSYEWGSESAVMLTLYEKDKRLGEYLSQKWPANWHVELVPMFGSGPTYNEMLRRYPHEDCYGFLADDVRLLVPGMLAELEREAGRWNIAYANDQRHGAANATMPCIGGQLARALGYLSPRNLVHMAIDSSLHEIGTQLGCLRYREDLKYDHLHPYFGTAPWDSTYERAHFYSFSWPEILKAWKQNDLPDDIERVLEKKKIDDEAAWA